MKKVIVEKVNEEIEYFCDKHPKVRAYASILAGHWYGSQFDNMTLEVHLCNECMEKFHANVKNTFGVIPKEYDE